ncbi:MAG: type III-B CRISPR module RAMP protein Cmr1 [Chloroflexota bacterium]
MTCKTLTPLWTGGVDQTSDRLHETGLIGSLRWWYEALVRGLGGYACDPTEHECQFDEDEYRKSKANDERQRLREAGLCDVCQVFGATGWGRKFRLIATDTERLFAGQNILIPSGRVHRTKKGDVRAGGWFLFSDSRLGEILLKIQPIREITQEELNRLKVTLALIAHWGTFGAKGASGYGVIDGAIDFSLDTLSHFLQNLPPRNSELPDLRDFFFTKFEFTPPAGNQNWWQSIQGIQEAFSGKLRNGTAPQPLRRANKELTQVVDGGILPIAPAIRNWLRYTWLPTKSQYKNAEAYIFGTAGENSIGSKIQVSYAYRRQDGKWEFHIWGWLPCQGKLQARDKFLDDLKNALNGSAIWWAVFGASGITPKKLAWYSLPCNAKDLLPFLTELLKEPGGAQ